MTLRVLLVLVFIGTGCRPHIRAPSSVRCYALQWNDTTWSRIIPNSVMLASGHDSARLPGAAGPFPLKSPQSSDSGRGRWQPITRAQWFALGKDSLILGFSTDHGDWSAKVEIRGDSLRGTVFFSGFDSDGSIPSPTTGVRFECPRPEQ